MFNLNCSCRLLIINFSLLHAGTVTFTDDIPESSGDHTSSIDPSTTVTASSMTASHRSTPGSQSSQSVAIITAAITLLVIILIITLMIASILKVLLYLRKHKSKHNVSNIQCLKNSAYQEIKYECKVKNIKCLWNSAYGDIKHGVGNVQCLTSQEKQYKANNTRDLDYEECVLHAC